MIKHMTMLSFGILVFLHSVGHGAIVELSPIKRGWYSYSGSHVGVNGPASPLDNYATGRSASVVSRNWFAFDLSSVSGVIVSAELVLDTGNYKSPDPIETYELRHVATPIPDLGIVQDFMIFEDLADGSVYGSREYSLLDQDQVRPIYLNSVALADLNTAIGSDIAFGGHISSLSGQTEDFELVFGRTLNHLSILRLDVQAVPEPSTITLFTMAGLVGAFVAWRKRKRT